MPQTGSVSSSAIPIAAIFIRLSESSRKFPESTIRSPAIRPLVTSIRSSIRHPVSTRRGSK